MPLGDGLDRDRIVAELMRQRFRRIPDDGQSAATLRSVRGERRDDEMTARLDDRGHVSQVRCAIGRIGQEVEDGTIVPDVDRVSVPVSRDVRFEPAGDTRVGAEPDLCAFERLARRVQDSDADEASRQEMIDETGIPASNIDQSSAGAGAGCLDQLE